MNFKTSIPLDSELMKLSIKRAKEMIANLEAGGSETNREFLPIYNRITGRKETGGCPGCWKARIKLLKKTMEIIEQHELFKADADARVEEVMAVLNEAVGIEKEEEELEPEKPAPLQKKKRGRPKTKK